MKYEVSTSLPITFEKKEKSIDNRFTYVTIWLAHVGANLNSSYFSKEVLENELLPSLQNIPILGYITKDNFNEADFNGHEQRIIIDKDGVKLEYIGQAFGLIPEDNNARFETKVLENGDELEFLVVDGILWNRFENCIDIFERDGTKSQSMELEPSSIDGEFKNDGFFYFTKCSCIGACILGENATPAMQGSIIEKVDMFSIKQSLQEMIKEYKELLTSNFTKGGQKMDEKLELLKKYSLTKEQIQEKGITDEQFEQFSIEELEEKLKEFTAESEGGNSKTKSKTEPTNFALTANQLKDELRAELRKIKAIDDWGWEWSRYWYVDHDDNMVYAEDSEDAYRFVGFMFTVEGDYVIIDFDSKQRVKLVFEPFEGNEPEDVFTLASKERLETEFERSKEKEIEDLKKEFEKEKENAIYETKKEYKDVDKKFESLKNKITELEQFKADKLQEEREQKENELFEQFTSQLTDEELQEVKDKKDQFTLEELEKELYVIAGKKAIQFTSKKKDKEDKKTVSFNFEKKGEEVKTTRNYADIVKKYTKSE